MKTLNKKINFSKKILNQLLFGSIIFENKAHKLIKNIIA